MRCGFVIDPEWISCDKTVQGFFDYLKAMPGMENVERFRRQCEARERDGRSLYGHKHLARDSIIEGTEEAADGANYAHFALLKAKRERRTPPVPELFEAAWHFAKAHEALLRARQVGD